MLSQLRFTLSCSIKAINYQFLSNVDFMDIEFKDNKRPTCYSNNRSIPSILDKLRAFQPRVHQSELSQADRVSSSALAPSNTTSHCMVLITVSPHWKLLVFFFYKCPYRTTKFNYRSVICAPYNDQALQCDSGRTSPVVKIRKYDTKKRHPSWILSNLIFLIASVHPSLPARVKPICRPVYSEMSV